jgi:hypothetical protein
MVSRFGYLRGGTLERREGVGKRLLRPSLVIKSLKMQISEKEVFNVYSVTHI